MLKVGLNFFYFLTVSQACINFAKVLVVSVPSLYVLYKFRNLCFRMKCGQDYLNDSKELFVGSNLLLIYSHCELQIHLIHQICPALSHLLLLFLFLYFHFGADTL